MSAYIDIVFEGNKFTPSLLKDEGRLPIESITEYGEIGKIGRYKGKPTPYGLALLKIEGNSSEELNQKLNVTINILLDNKPLLKRSGVNEITLDLESNTLKDFDIKIDKSIVKKISDLSANIEISSLTESHQVEAYFQHVYLTELYTSILKDEVIRIQMTKLQKDRIEFLFKNRMDENKINNLHLSYTELMSRVILYLLKYSKAKKIENIPSLEDVLK